MSVTPEERDAMARLMMMMEGKTPPPQSTPAGRSNDVGIELAGPGQVTSADINAMADVMKKLSSVTTQVINESHGDPELNIAVHTTRNDDGVKVGRYQIMIKEDQKRLAGKQYYSIYNTKTHDIIADDLSLYETALKVVKMLNDGKYANSPEVRILFDHDDHYTAHKQDAVRYKRALIIAERKGDRQKMDIYESRCQASLDRAMSFKKDIKNFRHD